MSTSDAIIDPRLAKAAAHPLRMQILVILNERVASPVEIARELDEPLANVSYHVKMLESLECIELVSTTPRRGAVEHHYRAVERAMLAAAGAEDIPLNVRRGIADGALSQILADVREAAAGTGFDRPDVTIARVPMTLDEQGLAKVAKRLADLEKDVAKIQAESAARIEKASKKDGDAGVAGVPVNVVWMLFGQGDPAPAKGKRRK